jgi:hypothetical protein
MTRLKVRIIFYLILMGSAAFFDFLYNNKYFNDIQYFTIPLVFYIIYVSIVTFILGKDGWHAIKYIDFYLFSISIIIDLICYRIELLPIEQIVQVELSVPLIRISRRLASIGSCVFLARCISTIYKFIKSIVEM